MVIAWMNKRKLAETEKRVCVYVFSGNESEP